MGELSDLILPETVMLRLNAPSRDLVILGLCKTLAQAAHLDARRIYDPVLMRERLAGTGVGEGVAIPHAMVEGLPQAMGAFARLDPPSDFAALDARPADLVFLLLAPKGRGGDHLKALARVSRFLRRGDVRARLRAARSQDELCAVFFAGEVSDAA